MTFRRLVQHNFWLKLLSIILAVAVWFLIRVGLESEPVVAPNPLTNPTFKHYVLPVYVLTDPADAQVFQITPETVYVSLTGESAVLEKYERRDYKVYLDLTDPKAAGQTNMEVRYHVPGGVSVIGIQPRAVDIERISPVPNNR